MLFKATQLSVSYGINMVAIADGKPQVLGLLQILDYYVKYQREYVVKRTKCELDAAKRREHILEGLVIAVNNIDAVVKVIKTVSPRPKRATICAANSICPSARRTQFSICALHA